jgi:hypothetical protein
MGDGYQVGNFHFTGEGVSFVRVLVNQRRITGLGLQTEEKLIPMIS